MQEHLWEYLLPYLTMWCDCKAIISHVTLYILLYYL